MSDIIFRVMSMTVTKARCLNRIAPNASMSRVENAATAEAHAAGSEAGAPATASTSLPE